MKGDRTGLRDTARKKRQAADRAREDRDGDSHITLPHVLLDSEGWRRASHTALAMLPLIAYPLFRRGQNGGLPNGGLLIDYQRLARHGWTSKEVITSALKDLIECGLLCETRKGGKHRPSLYGVTWLGLGIDPRRYVDLDIDPSTWDKVHRGSYRNPVKAIRPPQTDRTAKATAARRANAVARRGFAAPSDDRKEGRLDRRTVAGPSAIGPSDGPVDCKGSVGAVPSNGTSLEHCHLRVAVGPDGAQPPPACALDAAMIATPAATSPVAASARYQHATAVRRPFVVPNALSTPPQRADADPALTAPA